MSTSGVMYVIGPRVRMFWFMSSRITVPRAFRGQQCGEPIITYLFGAPGIARP